MREDHILSVILFADIAGYTSLMQKNEEKALLQLNRFKEVLESETTNHNGRVIQYFGDGCLLSFASSTQGVSCAIDLQKNFSTSPEVPVRIGMHLGDVVFKNNNVFGDGVNIASRIESLGIPGAILLSKAIRDQIKNKADFLLVSLGTFEFKNVDESIEVFAVANPGFVIPKREEMQGKLKEPLRKKRSRWSVPALIIGVMAIAISAWLLGRGSSGSPLSKELREKPVAVLAFENETMDKNLDAFGLMAKDWISQGLLESGKAHVIKTEESEKQISKPQGAEVLIRGRYYNKGTDELAIAVELVDAKTDSVIYAMSPFIGKKDDPMPVLGEIQQQLLGYWNLSDKLLGKKPPRYDAYESYLKGLSYQGSDYKKAESYHKNALKIDPKFNNPLFSLVTLSITTTQPELRDSIIAVLEKKEAGFTDYEKLNWESLKARVNGDFEKAATLNWKLYEKYHMESGGRSAISLFRANNYLHTTLEKYRLFKPTELKPEDSYQGQIPLGEAFEALSSLGLHDTVLAWINNMNYPVLDGNIALVHLRALVHLHKMDELKKVIHKYRNLEAHSYWVPSMLDWRVCVELYLLDRKEELPEYIGSFEKAVLDDSGSMFYNYFLSIISYMRGEFPKAYELAKRQYDVTQQFVFFTEMPAVCLIKMGKIEKAKEWIEQLIQKGSFYPGQLDYAIGVIKAHLGEKEEAVNYLTKSFKGGFDFDFYCFREDFLLKELFSYGPFIELTEPK